MNAQAGFRAKDGGLRGTVRSAASAFGRRSNSGLVADGSN